MTEYIEREAAVNAVLGITIASPIVAQHADAALFNINKIPAADVVPIVRCYDCELWEAYTGHNGDEGLGWCDNGAGDTTHALFFCASGRRAERI